MLTLSDRRESRSLIGMKLVPDGQLDDDSTTWVNFLYNLCQGGSTDLLDFLDELKPTTWKQFHEVLIADPVEKTTVGYGPFFPESPTHPDVVAESVNYCVGVAKKLGQDHCVITCDQAIYEIVLGLQKKYPEKYGNIIIRMGGFHIAMNFLGAIGYLMKETGIEDILVDSGICQPGTVNKLLDGKDYYAMVLDSACKYICALYGKKDFPGSLDELRCHLFKTKKSDIRSLPPTSDAFRLHLRRALYQILIWKRATIPKLSLPPPTKFGRDTDNGYLLATRMTKSPKPNLPSNKCNCQKDKCRSRCPCRNAEVQCTKQCRCDAYPRQCNLAAEILKENEHDYLVQ